MEDFTLEDLADFNKQLLHFYNVYSSFISEKAREGGSRLRLDAMIDEMMGVVADLDKKFKSKGIIPIDFLLMKSNFCSLLIEYYGVGVSSIEGSEGDNELYRQ